MYDERHNRLDFMYRYGILGIKKLSIMNISYDFYQKYMLDGDVFYNYTRTF